MSCSTGNEVAEALCRAIGVDPSKFHSVTFTSKVGQGEQVTLTGEVWNADLGMFDTIRQTWKPTEDA